MATIAERLARMQQDAVRGAAPAPAPGPAGQTATPAANARQLTIEERLARMQQDAQPVQRQPVDVVELLRNDPQARAQIGPAVGTQIGQMDQTLAGLKQYNDFIAPAMAAGSRAGNEIGQMDQTLAGLQEVQRSTGNGISGPTADQLKQMEAELTPKVSMLESNLTALSPDDGVYEQVKREAEDARRQLQAIQNQILQMETEQYYAGQAERKKALEQARDRADFEAVARKGREQNQAGDPSQFFDAETGTTQYTETPRDAYGEAAGISRFISEGMTEDERKVFWYYVGAGEPDKAKEYAAVIERDVNARVRGSYQQDVEKFAKEHPVLGAVGNMAGWPLNIPAYLATAKQGIKNAVTGRYEPADVNSPAYMGARFSAGTAEGTSEAARDWATRTFGNETAGSVAAFLTQTGLSIGQNAAQTAVLGPYSLIAMGLSAAGQASTDALERGATPGQAFLLGTANGAVEIATEKLPLDNILKIASTKGRRGAKQVIVDGLKQMGSEASEEMISEIADNLLDTALMRDKSEYRQFVKQLVDGGMTPEEAERRAFLQFYVYNVLLSGAGGGLSGGVMAGGASLFSLAGYYADTLETARGADLSAEDIQSFIDEGLAANMDTRAYKLAAEAMSRTAAGETLSDREVAALWRANMKAQEQGRMSARPQEAEIQTPEAGKVSTPPQVKNGTVGALEGQEGQNKSAPEAGTQLTLVQRVQQAIPEIQDMAPVASVTGEELPKGGKIVDRLVGFINSIGNKVNRPGFGDVLFSRGRVKNSVLGHGFGQTKVDSFAAVPAVIKYGAQIDYQQNWKGRSYDTYTFAAPVTYKGQSTYMGVIVTKDSRDGRYYVHEVVDGEGNLIYENREDAGLPSDGTSALSGDLDTVASPASDNILSQQGQESNRKKDPADILIEGGREARAAREAAERTGTHEQEAQAGQNAAPAAAGTGTAGAEAARGGVSDGDRRRDAGAGAYTAPLPDGRTGWQRSERPRERSVRVPEEVRQKGGGKAQREIAARRAMAAQDQDLPVTSPAAIGIPNGAEAETLRVLPEADWDEEIRQGVEWAYSKGVRDVKVVVGDLGVQMSGPEGTYTGSVLGVYDPAAGTLTVRADAASQSFSETIEHEVAHLLADDAAVTDFKNSITGKYHSAAWLTVYNAYERAYAGATGDYEGMNTRQKNLYIWGEMLADAYSDKNKFGSAASLYGAEADAVLEGRTAAMDGGGRYSVSESITQEDVKAIQSIGQATGRISVNQFNSQQIQATEKFARRYWEEMGTKSPFFRAWFGDWRANDQTPVDVADTPGSARGPQHNADTGWDINVSGKVFAESQHFGGKNTSAIPYLAYINDIVKKAVLLDSQTLGRLKSQNSLMMHSLYAVADIGSGPEVLKLYVEEMNDPNNPDTAKRAYQLQNIEKAFGANGGVQGSAPSPLANASNARLTVSDLFQAVKQRDPNFRPNPVSKVVDEDGKPLVVYHGTDADFTVFDRTKARANMDIQGNFFSPWEDDARGYGGNVGAYYLDIKNPADDGVAYKALNRFKGQNNAGVKAREYLVSLGYDGVNNYGEEYIAFFPEQVKSATDNTGAFDRSNPDIRYSVADADQEDGRTAAEALRDDITDRVFNFRRVEAIDEEQAGPVRGARSAMSVDRGAPSLALREDAPPRSPALANEAPATRQAAGPDTLFRPEGMSDKQYNWLNQKWQEHRDNLAEQKEQTREQIMGRGSRDTFTGTEALKKLGVKVEGSVGVYGNVESLLANERAARQVEKQIRAAEKRLEPTEKERSFANGLAAGIYDEADIPRSVDADKVLELADYYMAKNAFSERPLARQRGDIKAILGDEMRELFKDSEHVKPSGALVLNNRTPERNMLHIFGDGQGKAINDFIFDPVAKNEAERYRWVNQMHDRLRSFQDSKGKRGELNKPERFLTQLALEGKSGETLLDMADNAVGDVKKAAEAIGKGMSPKKAAAKFGLDQRSRTLAVTLAKWQKAQSALESGKADSVKVDNAVKAYREVYDELYDAVNDFLAAHGYAPIGFVKGYAPHFQSQDNLALFDKALQSMGIRADVGKLPASIAGLTADFKPGKRWDPHFLTRLGDVTEYDAAKGFEQYIEYVSDIFYHTDDIAKVREAANYFRETYAPENIKDALRWARDLYGKSAEEKANFLRDNGVISRTTALSEADVEERMSAYIEELYKKTGDTTKFSDMVMYLDNYANILAGKQSMADRGWEYSSGRGVLTLGNKFIRAFGRSNVAANISSALNQTAQMPQIAAELGPIRTAHAIADAAAGRLRKAAWIQQSDFLTGKDGVNYLVKTPGEMVLSAIFKPAELVDSLTSAVAVRAKYLQEISRGKDHKAAMAAADAYAKAVMGSRMKGSKPLGFEAKNPVSQAVRVFQVEALNSWEHIFQDLPRDFRAIKQSHGAKKAALALAGVIVKMLLGAFVWNRLSEALYGGTPAPMDVLGISVNFIASGEGLTTNAWLRKIIDDGAEKLGWGRVFDTEAEAGSDGFDWGAAGEDTLYNVMNDVPIVRNVAGVLGLGDQSLPMPDLYGKGKNLYTAIKDDGLISPETGKAALDLATEIMPGGRQVSKTAQGIEAVVRGGKYKGYGDGAKLQYPIEEGAVNAAKTILFGPNSTEESRAYYAGDGKALSAKQTRMYKDFVADGMKRGDAYQAVKGLAALEPEEGRAGVTDNQKALAIAELGLSPKATDAAIESTVSEGAYNDYQAALAAGIEPEIYFTWLLQIAWYTADQDENGKTISGSKKEKVVESIDALELTESQKDLLYQLQAYAEKDLSKTPWH